MLCSGLKGLPVAVAGLFALLTASSCGGGGGSGGGGGIAPPPATIPPSSTGQLVFTTDQGLVLSGAGQTYTFKVGVEQPGGAVTPVSASWQSKNPSIATVDQSGTVTTTGSLGSATIVASYGTYTPIVASVEVATLQAGTIILPSSVVQSLSANSAVLAKTTQTEGLQPGQIVVTGTSGGLLYKITSVATNSNTVTIGITEASIPQAFSNYSFSLDAPVQQLDIHIDSSHHYTVSNPQGRVLESGEAPSYSCTDKVTGEVVVDPFTTDPSIVEQLSLQPIASLNLNSPQSFELAFSSSIALSLNSGSSTIAANASLNAECTASITIAPPSPFAIPPIFSVDPTVTDTIGFEVRAQVGGGFTIQGPTASLSVATMGGVQYSNGAWQSVAQAHSQGTFNPGGITLPRASVSADFKPYFRVDAGGEFCAGDCGTLLSVTIADFNFFFAEIYDETDFGLSSPFDDTQAGYAGPRLSNVLGAEAGPELQLQDSLLSDVLKWLGIEPPSIQWVVVNPQLTLWSQPVPTVEVSPSAAAVGATVEFISTVPAGSNQTVDFYAFVNSGSAAEHLVSATPNSSGVASASWTAVAGNYAVYALLNDPYANLPFPSPTSVPLVVISPSPSPTPTGGQPIVIQVRGESTP